MKKTIKIMAFCGFVLFTGFSLSSCKVITAIGKALLESADGEKTDSDHIDLNDDGSVQDFYDTFEKVEKFHGNLKYVSKNNDLYTIQVNRNESRKYETGYIVPNSVQNSRQAGDESDIAASIDKPVVFNKTPDFIREFNKDKNKFLRTVNVSRGAVDYDDGESGSSSDSGNSDSENNYELGSERSFYVAESMKNTNTGATKKGILKYKSENCLIYLAEEDIKKITNASEMTYSNTSFSFVNSYFTTFGETFDTLYSSVTNVMGDDDLTVPFTINSLLGTKTKSISTSKTGVDSKVVIFINDIFNDKLGDSNGSVLGYFWECDLYQNKDYINKKGEQTLFSNECKIIYLDSYWLQSDYSSKGKLVQSTMVHEFTHMLNRINKKDDYDIWFTEMLAMTSEDILSSQLNLYPGEKTGSSVFDQRLPYFCILYGNGFSAEAWENDYASAYSNTYAFGAYLLRNYGGVKLINSIAKNDSVNEEAITKALKYCEYDETFESVLAKFGQVLLNFDKRETAVFNSKDKYITLNRDITAEEFGKLTYHIYPVKLNGYSYTDDNGTKYSLPIYKDNTKRYSIGGWGVEIKEFGTASEYNTFDAQLPTNQSCDLYVYLK